jgi:surfeit locus 1 family protein
MVRPRNAAEYFHSSTVIALLLAAVATLALANWQWQRGQARQALLDGYAAQSAGERSLLSWPSGAAPDMSRVQFHGQALGAALLLQNSLLNDGRSGVRVLQPYLLDDASVILVDRGWLAQNAPGPTLRLGDLDVHGRWLATPQRFTLPGAIKGSVGRVDDLDLPALQRRLQRTLRRGVVVLEHTDAPLIPWPAQPDVDPTRNYSYAMQWLLMSLGLCAVLVRLLWRWRHR